MKDGNGKALTDRRGREFEVGDKVRNLLTNAEGKIVGASWAAGRVLVDVGGHAGEYSPNVWTRI